MALSNLTEKLPALTKALPLLALTACGPSTAELDEVRARVQGLSLAEATNTLNQMMWTSCDQKADAPGRIDMDAIVTVRNEVGGDLLNTEATKWICDGQGLDQTYWNIPADEMDLLNHLYVGDSDETRAQVKRKYDEAARLDHSLAAEFTEECTNDKPLERKALAPITARRDSMLQENGFAPQEWYCTEILTDKFKAKTDTTLVAASVQHEQR